MAPTETGSDLGIEALSEILAVLMRKTELNEVDGLGQHEHVRQIARNAIFSAVVRITV